MKRNSIMLDSLQWINQVCKEIENEFISEHFDCFTDYIKNYPKGLNLLTYAVNILIYADAIRKKELEIRKSVTIFPFIYLPLSVSEEINFWCDNYWNDLGKDFEPPSLCFSPTEKFFETISQEYKTPVKMPIEGHEIQALFRSYKRIDDIENDWEFSNGIYLFCNDDVKKIP